MENKVRGRGVDILETTICHMVFGLEFPTHKSKVEFDHKVMKTWDLIVMRDLECRANFMRWVAGLIAELGPELAWVATESEPIIKGYLSFTAKF